MSWSRSARKSDGTFDVEVRDYNNNIYFTGKFNTLVEAEKKAQEQERLMMLDMRYGKLEDDNMSIDDIIKELAL